MAEEIREAKKSKRLNTVSHGRLGVQLPGLAQIPRLTLHSEYSRRKSTIGKNCSIIFSNRRSPNEETHGRKSAIVKRAGSMIAIATATTSKMDQRTEARSWVQKPQHRQWGFEEPRPERLKILIDLRPKDYQPTFHAPPARGSGPSLSSLLSHHYQSKASDLVVQSLLRSYLLILSNICRPEGSNPAGLTSKVFLYICSPNLVSRNTNRQISDQARSTTRIFVHSETSTSKEPTTDTLEVDAEFQPTQVCFKL